MGEVHDLVLGIQGSGRKICRMTVCISKQFASESVFLRPNTFTFGIEAQGSSWGLWLWQDLGHTDQFPAFSMLKSWLRGQGDSLLTCICHSEQNSLPPSQRDYEWLVAAWCGAPKACVSSWLPATSCLISESSSIK